jgi:SAM-dependent methyltransferase
MAEPEAYPEILNVDLSDAFVGAVQALVEKTQLHFTWSDFGRLPASHTPGNSLAYWRDRYWSQWRRQYRYLYGSPAHEDLLRDFRASAPAAKALLFDLFCLNAPVKANDLQSVLTPSDIDGFARLGLFIRRNDEIRLAVTLVPFEDRYYLADGRHMIENRSQYGITPAHISDQTHRFSLHSRALLDKTRVARILEMGCGIGIVMLELKDCAAEREGVDIYQRNVDFATANAKLRGDTNARFYQSDLFSNVQGTFDIIIANLWQPTEQHLSLITRFISEGAAHLSETGEIMCYIHTTSSTKPNAALTSLAQTMSDLSLAAKRYVVSSWFAETPSGEPAVGDLSMLRIYHAAGRDSRRVDLSRTTIDLAGAFRSTRRLVAAGRRLVSRPRHLHCAAPVGSREG